MDRPVLKYIGCSRGPQAAALKSMRDRLTPNDFQRIDSGPLKGCYRWDLPRPLRTEVVKFGRGFALRFRVVLRITYP